MAVSLVPCDDMAIVKEIVTLPDIWERISDGVDSDNYYPSTDSTNQWLVVVENDTAIGIIYLHCDTSCSLGFHPYMMKAHRKHGRDMMKAFFKWFLDNIPDQYVKINVVIPDCFKSTINFAKRNGFVEEGICRESYTKDGGVFNRVMLGITRKEVIQWAA